MTTPPPLLDISGLTVDYPTSPAAVRDVSLSAAPGASVGVIGESGSGKTTLLYAIARLLPAQAYISSGSVTFGGRSLLELSADEMRQIRWREISIVFQGAMHSLNPVFRIGTLLEEVLAWRGGVSDPNERRERAAASLDLVDVPRRVLRAYPHELSGGMRQRVTLAMTLLCEPRLVLADEPTTSLDVVVQEEILERMATLRAEFGFTLVLVTHDLALVSEYCDDMVVMYRGEVVEAGPMDQTLISATHPHTRDLIKSYPSVEGTTTALRRAPTPGFPGRRRTLTMTERTRTAPDARAVVSAVGLGRRFRTRRGNDKWLDAVSNVDIEIRPATITAVVGASGAGKSTLGRMLALVERPTSGDLTINGVSVSRAGRAERRQMRRAIQVVHQDPYDALNPRFSIADSIAEGLHASKLSSAERVERIREAMNEVGLAPVDSFAPRKPGQLSGGQCQRAAIARAVIGGPQLIIADEPVASLDVSIRLGVLRLFSRIRDYLGVSIVLVTHDLGTARAIADRVMVMESGVVVEEGPSETVFNSPKHQYTRLLLDSAPRLRTDRQQGGSQ